MAFKGMSPDEGREVAGEITEAGSRMLEHIDNCTSIVTSVNWIGPDSDAYTEDWNAFVSGPVNNLVEILSTKSDQLRQHAEQQDTTSNQE